MSETTMGKQESKVARLNEQEQHIYSMEFMLLGMASMLNLATHHNAIERIATKGMELEAQYDGSIPSTNTMHTIEIVLTEGAIGSFMNLIRSMANISQHIVSDVYEAFHYLNAVADDEDAKELIPAFYKDVEEFLNREDFYGEREDAEQEADD